MPPQMVLVRTYLPEVLTEQLEILVSFMERNPLFVNGESKSDENHFYTMWKELSRNLNYIQGSKINLSAGEWEGVWQDLVRKVKVNVANARRKATIARKKSPLAHIESVDEQLDEVEKRVFQIIEYNSKTLEKNKTAPYDIDAPGPSSKVMRKNSQGRGNRAGPSKQVLSCVHTIQNLMENMKKTSELIQDLSNNVTQMAKDVQKLSHSVNNL